MRIFFSVGEPSGDQHAAGLIRELKQRVPQLAVTGYGGPLMERAGCRLHFQLTDLAVMGLVRVIPLLGRFYALVQKAKRILREERPDAVVLVDFPGFNWWIARAAKNLGIPVFYFLPPQLWAWAPWRIRRVRRNIDHVLCGLSFEQHWYQDRGVPAEYVGHPFYDEIQRHELDQSFVETWQSGRQRNLGLLPGSRTQEVELNWPVMVAAIGQLEKDHPDVRFLVACFNEAHRERCEQLLSEQRGGARQLPIKFFVGKTPEIIAASDCCLMVSGSVSLEMLARATPAVVVYYLTWPMRLVRWAVVRCEYISLPNLMVGRSLLPEYLPSGDVTTGAGRIAAQVSSWLQDDSALKSVEEELRKLRSEVVQVGALAKAADAITSRLPRCGVDRAA